jgi:hypothetical protein
VDVELLVDDGVRLCSGRRVSFGMGRGDVDRVLHDECEVFDELVFHADWGAGFVTCGLKVTVSASTEAGLDCISLRSSGPEPAVVALDGIDLFGWPADDVVDALGAAGWPIGSHKRTNTWIGPRRLLLSSSADRDGARRFEWAVLYSPTLGL